MVEADLPAYPGVAFRGTVSALNLAIDPGSRAMTIEAKFANVDRRLTPGMSGSAQVYLSTTEPAVFVPSSALVKVAGGTSSAVYIVDGDKAQVCVVQPGDPGAPGDNDQGMIRIQSGLRGGEVIATSNLARLFDGAAVRIAAAASGAGGIAAAPR